MRKLAVMLAMIGVMNAATSTALASATTVGVTIGAMIGVSTGVMTGAMTGVMTGEMITAVLVAGTKGVMSGVTTRFAKTTASNGFVLSDSQRRRGKSTSLGATAEVQAQAVGTVVAVADTAAGLLADMMAAVVTTAVEERRDPTAGVMSGAPGSLS